MIYVKISDDIETAKKVIAPVEDVCFVHDRTTNEVHIVIPNRFESRIIEHLSVETLVPFSEQKRKELLDLDNTVISGNPMLIQ